MGGIGIRDGDSPSLSRLRMYTGIQGKQQKGSEASSKYTRWRALRACFLAYAVLYLKEKQNSYVAFSYALVFD